MSRRRRDGRKVLVLCNHGSPLAPDLRVEDVFKAPANRRDPRSGNPERSPDAPWEVSTADVRAWDNPTWHEMAEQRFAKEIAETLERIRRERRNQGLHSGRSAEDSRRATPRTSATRSADIVVAEVAKDLTPPGHPVPDIQQNLAEMICLRPPQACPAAGQRYCVLSTGSSHSTWTPSMCS